MLVWVNRRAAGGGWVGNKINEHWESRQRSGAKLWFLRNQGSLDSSLVPNSNGPGEDSSTGTSRSASRRHTGAAGDIGDVPTGVQNVKRVGLTTLGILYLSISLCGMSRWAVPKADGLRIRILDVKMGSPIGGRLENQDPGCQDGPSQRRTA